MKSIQKKNNNWKKKNVIHSDHILPLVIITNYLSSFFILNVKISRVVVQLLTMQCLIDRLFRIIDKINGISNQQIFIRWVFFLLLFRWWLIDFDLFIDLTNQTIIEQVWYLTVMITIEIFFPKMKVFLFFSCLLNGKKGSKPQPI